MTTAIAVKTDYSIEQVMQMADIVVASGLFPVKTPQQAGALMLLCQAKGMHPMEALEEYHIVQNRPTMKAERMMSKFQEAGGKVVWKELTDEKAEATFSHPLGGSLTISWTLEMAKRAGLAGKDNWKNYGRAMLRSRCVSEGIKSVLPGVTRFVYTPEEAIDIEPQAERDVTPPKPATGVAALTERLKQIAPGDTKAFIAAVDEHSGGDDVPTLSGMTAAEAFELTPPTVEEQVLAQLRDTALEGQKPLQETWEGLTKDLRKSLAAHLPSLKEAAAKAEASQAALRG